MRDAGPRVAAQVSIRQLYKNTTTKYASMLGGTLHIICVYVSISQPCVGIGVGGMHP